MSLTDDQIIHLGDGSLGLNEILEVEKLAVSVQCQQGSMLWNRKAAELSTFDEGATMKAAQHEMSFTSLGNAKLN